MTSEENIKDDQKIKLATFQILLKSNERIQVTVNDPKGEIFDYYNMRDNFFSHDYAPNVVAEFTNEILKLHLTKEQIKSIDLISFLIDPGTSLYYDSDAIQPIEL